MYEDHKREALKRIKFYKRSKKIKGYVLSFYRQIVETDWWKNWFCLGVPIYQAPMDLAGMAEIIWNVKPDVIIETGIKFGGSLLWNASQLVILEACGVIDEGHVIGVDVKIPKELRTHPLFKKITMLKGSSTDKRIVDHIKELIKDKKRVLIFLDSYHSHSHVLQELKMYSPLVTLGSYIVVEDTGVQDLVSVRRTPRSQWRVGDSPRTAVWEFMKNNKEFVIDKDIEAKILYTAYPDGYLKRIK